MRLLVICLLCISALTQVYAEERIGVRSPAFASSSASTEHSATNSNSRSPAVDSSTSGHSRLKKGNQAESLPEIAAFTPFSTRCVRQGDLVNFSGQYLTSLPPMRLFINVDNSYIALKQISLSQTQLIAQLPMDSRLQKNHRYPIVIQDQHTSSHSQSTALTITMCSFSSEHIAQKNTSSREHDQLVLLIKRATLPIVVEQLQQLGLSILQQHALVSLDSILLTIQVVDQNIEYTLNDLRTRFPDTVIDVNSHYQATASPRLYAAEMIAWPKLSQSCRPATKITIGLIDGMIDKTHPALVEQAITVSNFLNPSEQPEQQHGTAIAIILAGDKPDSDYQGLLSELTILAASVLRQQQDSLIATTESIVRAVDWMLINKVRLVNISLSGTQANAVLKSVFGTAINKGMIIFAAAGNNGKTASPSYPAALEGVIAITAVDAAQHIYKQANQGDYIDFAAPGVDIWTVDNGMQGRYRSGTSFASPYALAVAASYLSQYPTLSRDVLYKIIENNTKDLGIAGRDTEFGWGLVQASQLLCD